MAKKKKYFWLRLKVDFFTQKEIKKLRGIAGGDTYVIIYLKLQLLSLKNEGKLYYEGFEDTFVKELALDIDENEENVQITFSFLQRHGLLELISEEELILPKTVALIGSECDSAERVRNHRENQKALQCNTSVTESNTAVTKCNTEKETEIKTEIDLDLHKEIDKELELERELEFNAFWSSYPRQIDKESTYVAWCSIVTQGYSKVDIVQSAKNYGDEVCDYTTRYIKYSANFLNDKTFIDYLPENYKVKINSNVTPIGANKNFNERKKIAQELIEQYKKDKEAK